jgi:hypothetical protein
MNTYLILEGLRENVKFWQYKFDTCSPKEAREMYQKVLDAKQVLKEFKLKFMPHLMIAPNPPQRQVSVRMSDWSENLEEYSNN